MHVGLSSSIPRAKLRIAEAKAARLLIASGYFLTESGLRRVARTRGQVYLSILSKGLKTLESLLQSSQANLVSMNSPCMMNIRDSNIPFPIKLTGHLIVWCWQ
jgi:hypothetical protein